MRARVVVVAIVLAAAIGAAFAFRDRLPGPWSAPPPPNGLAASGTVEATEAQLGFTAAGRIQDIAVREGDRVAAGDELSRLDRAEMMARRDEAQSRIDSARALLRELERGTRSEEVAQAKAARDAAGKRVEDVARDLERSRTLHQGGAIPKEALDKAELAVELVQKELERAEEQLRLLEAGPRRERIEAQRAALAQAEASLRAIDAALDQMILHAPFDGLITVRHREPGEAVSPGAAVLTLMNPNDRWVRIYVREDRIGAVRVGAGAEIRCDTFPEKRYAGEVRFIAPEAEFTPKNVQTAEERVRLVYAVEVRITSDPAGDLKPGMPADVRLDVGAP
jgi:HlyD family secretion protein